MVETRNIEKIVEKVSYEEIGDFSFVIRCECGKWMRIKIPILLCLPKEIKNEK